MSLVYPDTSAAMKFLVDERKSDALVCHLTRVDLIAAGSLTPLRSNDAIRLTVAIRLGVDELITYDRELADAAMFRCREVSASGGSPSTPP